MAISNTVQTEDLVSVGSRVSWSAILAGAAVAIGVQALLGILAFAAGGAVDSSFNARPSETLSTSAIIWMILTACVALFAGGVVTSLLTAGENKIEAAIYGIVMWATVTAVAAHAASFGVHHADPVHRGSERWDIAAQNAGVPADQIQTWQTKLAEQRRDGNTSTTTGTTTTTVTETTATSRARWWAFGAVWLSMFAAAAGAVVGAGPTFRLVAVTRTPVSGPVGGAV